MEYKKKIAPVQNFTRGIQCRRPVFFALISFVCLWNTLLVLHSTNSNVPLRHSFPPESQLPQGYNKNEKYSRRKDLSNFKDAPCLELECIKKKGTNLARSFEPSQNKSWRLILENSDSTPYSGILYVKVPKTGSSSIAGAILRIAKHHRTFVHYSHSSGQEYSFDRRDIQNSFLLASVRDPASRALSYYAYTASRSKQAGFSVQILLKVLKSLDNQGTVQKSMGRGGMQLAFTSPKEIPKYSAWKPNYPEYVLKPDRLVQHVNRTLENYDFLLVSNRMDESLVALAMLLSVDMTDILVIPSKVATTSKTSAGSNHSLKTYLPIHSERGDIECVPIHSIPDEIVSASEIQEFLLSKHWFAMNYGDYLLYLAANASLDLTIQSLGQDTFEKNLMTFKALQSHVSTTCQSRTYRPCNGDGNLQLKKASEECYKSDYGCGYKCIDQVVSEQQLFRHDKGKLVMT